MFFEIYVQFFVCLNHQLCKIFPYRFLSFETNLFRMVSTSTKREFSLNTI